MSESISIFEFLFEIISYVFYDFSTNLGVLFFLATIISFLFFAIYIIRSVINNVK